MERPFFGTVRMPVSNLPPILVPLENTLLIDSVGCCNARNVYRLEGKARV